MQKLIRKENFPIWDEILSALGHVSVQNKGFGCSICPKGSYSYFSKPGSSNLTVTHDDFKNDGFLI